MFVRIQDQIIRCDDIQHVSLYYAGKINGILVSTTYSEEALHFYENCDFDFIEEEFLRIADQLESYYG